MNVVYHHFTCIAKVANYFIQWNKFISPDLVLQWLRQPSRPTDRRNVFGDIVCFVLLTPLACVSAWLCITGASHYSQFDANTWETAGLIALSVFLFAIYLIWCVVSYSVLYHSLNQLMWKSAKYLHFDALIYPCGVVLFNTFSTADLALNYKTEYISWNFQFCLHFRCMYMCVVFNCDPKTDNSFFRSWWSLTSIMQVIARSIGTTSEQ